MIGLVLAGGKSQRMGTDKGSLVYTDQDQRTRTASLLAGFCEEVVLSTRPGQHLSTPLRCLEDRFIGFGPFGGLLTALVSFPEQAVLCLPVDTPLVNHDMLKELTEARNPNKIATCFYNPVTEFPEPLITIWEPAAYPIMLHYLGKGYTCPRKVLINEDIELVQASEPERMMNVNRPEDRAKVMRFFHQD